MAHHRRHRRSNDYTVKDNRKNVLGHYFYNLPVLTSKGVQYRSCLTLDAGGSHYAW